MRRVERLGNLADNVERPLRLDSAVAAQEAPQVRSFDVAHRQIEDAVFFAGGDDRDDVRMVEARGELRLAEEALTEAVLSRLERQIPPARAQGASRRDLLK